MSDLRVRRHTDGRVAIEHRPRWWVVIRLEDDSAGLRDASEEYVSGEGWSELLVAELPEPDGTERT